ncbi:MAG: hypothetical protein NT165_01115 [Candidatus Falkowbacteria bacterium]|nr:hypothetical protein [Candidatus Falkowbacteria bacterium]
MENKINQNFLKIISLAMLVGAVAFSFSSSNLPFAYYQVMNWFVLGAVFFLAWSNFRSGRIWLAWLAVVVGIFFNPINPIYLNALSWQILDGLAIVVFSLSFFINKKR